MTILESKNFQYKCAMMEWKFMEEMAERKVIMLGSKEDKEKFLKSDKYIIQPPSYVDYF